MQNIYGEARLATTTPTQHCSLFENLGRKQQAPYMLNPQEKAYVDEIANQRFPYDWERTVRFAAHNGVKL